MPKAVVFFDLDGTLLRDDKSVAPSCLDAIAELRQHHVLPVVATGRNIFEVENVLKQTQIDTVVSANGSYVQYQGKRLSQAVIPTNLVEDFTDYAKNQGDPIAWFNNEGFALNHETPVTDKNFELLHLHAHVEPLWYKRHRVNFMFVFNFDKEQRYSEHFESKLSLVRNNPRGLDTMLAGVSKATGIKTLLSVAKLAHLPTFGFGDELNDVPMLKLVDHPVVMGNGNPKVKQLAEFVTTSNMTDGIEHGLQHFGLL
ncbi:Cof-type HAD-IIB family hydrolase [Lacticaseibacillus pabuli]|uniref:Cof-type HAD-IIB family hydrolase n=1 Tax=Lacticaseibacillus pabuli TaxID=3025672 RepID=A0ABY7WQE0_9LACO|nr:Cof-type HAD-IIB family hydrolase [Lacticaseibacillus sp. KACC 23028]WDF82408.1 Cof-type HAD-IIB family hydrolase [Lacticaseibacillus sp. KACC 23028]